MSTAYITHPRYVEHTLSGHPEHAGRIQAIWQQLEDLRPRLTCLEAQPASVEAILQVHSADYLRMLERLSSAYDTPVLLNPDTYFCPTSLEIARLAAGGVIQALDEVLENRVDNALAIIRPPGHHAEPDNAMGFCLLGNVAIAVRHAQLAHHLERIMIVDYDVHHGNGTQDMLYDDPHSLFISTHQSPYYPGSGGLHETGRGQGIGYTVNIPLREGHGDESYYKLYSEIIWPLAERYKPQLLVVSAGFDAHWDDPLAGMKLSLSGYAHLTRELIHMAQKLCGGKIVFVLEGGYNLQVLAHGVRNIASALLGDDSVSDPLGPAPQHTLPTVQPLVAELKRIHNL